MRLSRNTHTDTTIDLLVEQLLFARQGGKCKCNGDLTRYQLHHIRYSINLTLNDLELLCPACHSIQHKLRKHKGLLRKRPI